MRCLNEEVVWTGVIPSSRAFLRVLSSYFFFFLGGGGGVRGGKVQFILHVKYISDVRSKVSSIGQRSSYCAIGQCKPK